jgi:transposase
VATLPRDEVAVYKDEVEVHLNPTIGHDWMGYGQQKEVLTPGKNVKRYLAGALDVRTGQRHVVEEPKTDSGLFVRRLGKLDRHYASAGKIHVILDNYGIHDSKRVVWALVEAKGRIRLHPLPPYCPNDNKIERAWQDLHAEVTRNHTCPDSDSLMQEVYAYLHRRAQHALGELAVPNMPPPKGL